MHRILRTCIASTLLAYFCGAGGTTVAGEAGAPVPRPKKKKAYEIHASLDKETALAPYAPPLASATREEWSDERLKKLIDRTVDFCIEKLFVTDPERPHYGMAYEHLRDNKYPAQAYGLDAMHDTQWFMTALIQASLVDPDGGYLDLARKYPIPFFTHLVNRGDELFPEQFHRYNYKGEEPLKGYLPRGFDDGEGYIQNGALRTFEKFDSEEFGGRPVFRIENEDGSLRYSYYYPSPHLLQDVANGMLAAWQVTHDPEIAKTFGPLLQYHMTIRKRNRPVLVPGRAAAYVLDDKNLMEKYGGGDASFQPEKNKSAYRPLYLFGKMNLRGYSDDLSWAYRAFVANAAHTGKPQPEWAWAMAWSSLSAMFAMECYYDNRPYEYGNFPSDLQASPQWIEGVGKLNIYNSHGTTYMGGRGLGFCYVGAGVLPTVRKHPEIWESRYRESFADDTLVRMVDDAPKTDGVREAVYDKSTPIKDGKTTLHLLSNMKTLHLFVESEADEVTLSLATALPPKHYRGNKPSGTVTIARDGTVTAGNAAGEDLLHVAAFQKGTPWKAEIRIPYTHVPAQAIWISGIDHGRYEVTLGETKKMVYLLSEPARLIRRLEEQALQSLETWWPIYQKVGAIPLSWRAATRTDEHREVPDLGNNAFFVKLMSVILIDRAGTSEWELMRKNAPKEPLPSSLPDSVIKAQGLEPK